MDFGTSTTQTISGQRTRFYLHPGQIFVSAESSAVTTILGSCVAVCLYDRHLEIGGINHFLLPFVSREGQAAGRFGDRAVRAVIDQLLALDTTSSAITPQVSSSKGLLSVKFSTAPPLRTIS